MNQQQIVQWALRELGILPQQINQRIQAQPTFELACEALIELKRVARKRYRELAFQWHPDRNHGDVEAEMRFKVLGQVLENFKRLELQEPKPVRRVVHFYPASSPFGTSTTVTGTNTGTGTAWQTFTVTTNSSTSVSTDGINVIIRVN
jgi:hypothetical protein